MGLATHAKQINLPINIYGAIANFFLQAISYHYVPDLDNNSSDHIMFLIRISHVLQLDLDNKWTQRETFY